MSGPTTFDPMDAILIAATNQLRTALAAIIPGGAVNGPKFVDIQPEGHPPASMGEWYVSLDEGEVRSNMKVALKEMYAISVWITKRTGKFAPDRRKAAYSSAKSGMGLLERSIIANGGLGLHNNLAVMNAATALLPAGDIFQQPLWYTGRPKTYYRGSDWIGDGEGEDTFMIRELRFSGMLRVQYTQSAE